MFTRRQMYLTVLSMLAMAGLLPATASATSAKPSCGEPTSFGSGNNWKMDCKVVFSNGPRAKVRVVQQGSTVTIRACAYGRAPKHFESLNFNSELLEQGQAQADILRLRRGSTCSLSGKPLATWGSLEHDWQVTADVSLFWDNKDLTAGITYEVA